MGVIEDIAKDQLKTDVPEFRAGDKVAVKVKIREGEKERTQTFEGIVIRRRGGGINSTFTVRKVSYGVGVERVFPIHSPMIGSITVKSRGIVRRSRLYYLRALKGKAARIKTKR